MGLSFKVIVDGMSDSEQSFKAVGGIGSELETEEVVVPLRVRIRRWCADCAK